MEGSFLSIQNKGVYTNGCLTTEISQKHKKTGKEIPMSYDEIDLLFKFVLYFIAVVGISMAGMFAIQMFIRDYLQKQGRCDCTCHNHGLTSALHKFYIFISFLLCCFSQYIEKMREIFSYRTVCTHCESDLLQSLDISNKA